MQSNEENDGGSTLARRRRAHNDETHVACQFPVAGKGYVAGCAVLSSSGHTVAPYYEASVRMLKKRKKITGVAGWRRVDRTLQQTRAKPFAFKSLVWQEKMLRYDTGFALTLLPSKILPKAKKDTDARSQPQIQILCLYPIWKVMRYIWGLFFPLPHTRSWRGWREDERRENYAFLWLPLLLCRFLFAPMLIIWRRLQWESFQKLQLCWSTCRLLELLCTMRIL